ncbi:MAG TPA: cell division protein FtsZ [Puia sp.]|uniref:cell division protein FtsZ n=1 Tax=Puia sp. TaxID=2045100 RepID=UPI002C651134|nr:cell division protein FtsZ [Puia sp.]HVU99271.1 cell division protein FtsZ [Puia sp.]
MIHFDLPKEKSSIIKVIGVGGGGSNAVNHMFSQNIEGVNFIICNTDAQAIAQSRVPNKVQLGPHLTQGLGAGANPDIGRQATEESLEEIKGILEVNTKMAFITAGMGGGTGTGGAPIISKICKDLGILTVGIITTPFSYEGKKRQLQAEEGIRVMKQYVDTLLVISNDKLRHQFGNLKMKEAFAKADNVLATAAKCITDVINSTGQINVDFADVCTVMRNGGVAILGSATAKGDSRAQKAIEEALNSPLLNDNDISGAKWILININSSEGEHEFTMDEVDIIQNYLLGRAGEHTDVILGLGYDNSLGSSLGITLIATGFEHKDPFPIRQAEVASPKKEEKILMPLNPPVEETPAERRPVLPSVESARETLNVNEPIPPIKEQEASPVPLSASQPDPTPFLREEKPVASSVAVVPPRPTTPVDEPSTRIEWVLNTEPEPATQPKIQATTASKSSPASAASGGYLARPSNIYAEDPWNDKQSSPEHNSTPLKEPTLNTSVADPSKEDDASPDMQLVFRDTEPAADEPRAHQTHSISVPNSPVEEPAAQDDADDLKRRAAERINKLRNLSFNVNAADPNNEFETVPAYIRRNLELYNTISNVENFYSNYEVKTDENNNTEISTINTFLDGKRPD